MRYNYIYIIFKNKKKKRRKKNGHMCNSHVGATILASAPHGTHQLSEGGLFERSNSKKGRPCLGT